MDSTGEILNSVVNDYENLLSLPETQLHEKVKKIRGNLLQIIIQHLTDIKKISAELQKVKHHSSQTQMVISFLKHLICHFPHPVFVPSTSECNSISNKTKEICLAEYKDFVFHIFTVVLNLLAANEISVIHHEVEHLFANLVQLIKLKNISMYQMMLTSLVELLIELYEVQTAHFDCDNDLNVIETVTLKSIGGSLRVANNNQPCLVVTTYDSLESLELAATKLLQPLLSDVSQLVSNKNSQLTDILLHQLELGLLPLKSCSLKCILDMIKQQAFNCEEHPYLLPLMNALFDQVLEGLPNELYLTAGFKECEINEYNMAVAEFFTDLFSWPNCCSHKAFTPKQFSQLCRHLVTSFSNTLVSVHSETAGLVFGVVENVLSYLALQLAKSEVVSSVTLGLCDQISCWILRQDMGSVCEESTQQKLHACLAYALILSILQKRMPVIKEDVENKPKSLKRHHPSKPEPASFVQQDFISQYSSGCLSLLKQAQNCASRWQSANINTNLELLLQLSTQLLNVYQAFLDAYSWCESFRGESGRGKITEVAKSMEFVTTFQSLCVLLFKAAGTELKSRTKFYKLLAECYETLVKLSNLFISWLYCFDGQPQEAQSLVKSCLAVLSVPWTEDHDWLDLNLSSSLRKSTVVSLCRLLRDAGVSVQSPSCPVFALCLKGLALLPTKLASSWRYSIFLKWALGNNNATMKIEGLTVLPYFCAQNPTSVSTMLNDLHDFIKSLDISTCSSEIMLSLSKLIAPLGVVLHGSHLIMLNSLRKQTHTEKKISEVEIGKHLTLCIADSPVSERSHALQDIQFFIRLTDFVYSYIEKHGNEKLEVREISCNFLHGLPLLLSKIDIGQKRSVSKQLLQQWFACLRNFPDVDVQLICQLIENSDGDWNEEILKETTDLCNVSLNKKCVKTQCLVAKFCGCIITTLNQACKPGSGQVGAFKSSLLILCQLACSVSAIVSSTAFLEIESFLKSDEEALNKLFLHRKSVSQKVVETLSGAKAKCRPVVDVLEDFAELFGLAVNSFVENNLSYLLSTAVLCSLNVPDANDEILSVLAQNTGKTKADMIMQNFKFIFCQAVMQEVNLDDLFKRLEIETRIKKDSMILLNYGSLIQHLVAHVSTNIDQVCSAVCMIHQIKSPDEKTSSISELLKPHLLSVLTFFNGQLRHPGLSVLEKQQICESIVCLLKLMGKSDIGTNCSKIVNTLCLAQHSLGDSAAMCCRAWDTLVRCADDPSLGSILSQVVAMILPFLDSHSQQVVATVKYLVMEKASSTKSHFQELHFLPKHEALAEVRKFLEKTVKKEFPSKNFMSQIEQAMKQVSHENSSVRVFALERVRNLLRENQTALQRHHLVATGSSDLVCQLVSTLLACCRDSNTQVRLLAVKNLGEIGAVAPDRLSLSTESKGKSPGCNHYSFDDLDFAYDLLMCVVQAFQAAKPKHQDISAYAVQELLKVYDCKDGSKETAGRRLWRRFPETVQAVLEPHLSSRYMLKLTEINLSSLKKPILHRKQKMGFQEWIGTMCAVLMQMATTDENDSSKVARVAQACAAVVRNDINVALFLLPHLVLEVLRRNSDHTNFIIDEVMAVLESTEQIKERRDSCTTDSATPSLQGNAGTKTPALHGSPLSQLSAQAIFTVLDHVTRWQRHPAPTAGGSLAKTRHANELEIAKNFLSRIPQKNLALASLRCRAHSRALLHFETYLRQSCGGKCDNEAASFLQRVYMEMDETDGVSGVVAVRGVEPTPETQLKLLQSTGALQDAVACYERIIRSNPDDLTHHKGFVKCLIDLGQSSTALSVIVGTLHSHQEWETDFRPLHVEACWRLGQWDLIQEKTEPLNPATAHTDWSVAVGRTLLAVKGQRWDECHRLLDGLYLSQTEALSAASMESCSYQRGYDSILRLHALSDLERAVSRKSQANDVTNDDVMSLWQLRLQLVQPSFRAREPMLSLQRVLLPLLTGFTGEGSLETDRHLGKLWLQSSKLARKSGHLQTAYGALLSAQQYALPQYCIEHAKWLWQKGESHQALLSLQRGVSEHFASATSSDEERVTRAKVMLLVAKLMEESSSFDSNTVLKQYKEVVTFMGDWEDSHFYCAKYYDKLMTAILGENRGTGKAHHLYYIMHHYGRSLCYGTSHIYESLTKLLTVWFDYGANAAKTEKTGKPQSHEDVQRMVEVIADLRKRLPAYIFLVAFSQLTSRICHQHEPTYRELKEILVKVMQAFPQRSLWSMLAISKSTFKQRASRCQEIFQRVAYKSSDLSKLINDSLNLTNQLLNLCNKPVTSIQPLSINSHFKSLKRCVESPSFSKIMLPLQQFMTVTLPQTKEKTNSGSQTAHDPFPDPTVHIVGFNDTVEILPSLQRPKKITIRASDGSSRIFLCKPKDDLRKDARLAEFAAIVNKCLKRDPESGRRQLRIRTYAVVPLNEECGLIEWVNDMHGLRPILLPIYKARGLHMTGNQLRALKLPVSETLKKKMDVFKNKLLPRHPPVFHEWFLSTFPDPSAWYNAKLAYARSVAVMSMVGYILGLGDRHGENILFDSNSGEAMHVDFNCLFNKGMTLEVPEIVPFRLTHNMVDAMGPTKYEGFFRRACEVTMNVLRQQREPLMSVLKTFIHDPLVEWSKKGRSGGSLDENSGEVINEKALSHINEIDKRLRGIVASKGLPLSTEGHVHFLIQEATDDEKLCQMYIGWAPFM